MEKKRWTSWIFPLRPNVLAALGCTTAVVITALIFQVSNADIFVGAYLGGIFACLNNMLKESHGEKEKQDE